MQKGFPWGQRISIVGTTGSGKTTLARKISQRCHIPHIELDALHWNSNWTAASDQVFQERVTQALKECWAIDGNYSKVRDIIWSQADTVVFLDYSFWLVMKRLLRRTLWRSLKQEELWNGNHEELRSFFSQDSIVLWMLKTYRRNRRKYPVLLLQPEYAHLAVVHLQSPQMIDKWLLNV